METLAVPKKVAKQPQKETVDEAVASVRRSLADALAGRIKPLSTLEEQHSK